MERGSNGLETLGRWALGVGRQDEGTTPTPLRRGVGSSFRRLDPELRALASAAYTLWRELAAVRANPYGDHSGGLLAGRMAVDATRWEDGLVILAAIRELMDGKSSPRWIPEWAREVGGERRKSEHDARMAQERRMWDDMDPEARRVMANISRAKAKGQPVSLEDVTCAVCRGFTETKCPVCSRPLHARACPTRHNAVCLPAAPAGKGSTHGGSHLSSSIQVSTGGRDAR